MRKILVAMLVLAVEVSGAGRAIADVAISFLEQSHREPPKGANMAATTEDFPVTVTLGARYFATEQKGLREIFDFGHRRYYRINLADKTFEERNLYSVPGSITSEFQNRLTLGGALNAAKVDQDVLSEPALLEHLFSLTAPDLKTVVDRSHANGTSIFRWKDKELLAVSDEGRPIPEGYAKSYWLWMRYHLGGHPKIYPELEKSPLVPNTLQVIRTNFGVETATLRLKSLAADAAPLDTTEGYAAKTPAGEPYVSLQRLAGREANALELWSAKAQRDRDEAYSEGRSLDAMIIHMAYTMGSGDRNPVWLTAARDRLAADPLASAFVAALSVQNRDQMENAVKTFDGLRNRAHTPYSYVIDVFLANDLSALGQREAAEKLLLGTLTRNVLLTGAWYDLAKLYYYEFRAPEAWACWDAARLLRPGHAQQVEIDSFERKLLTEHPEFF